jgi:hypothetical protein
VLEREEVTLEQRKFNKKELHNSYSLSYVIPSSEIDGTRSMCGRDEKYVQNLVGKPERKRPLRRRKWDDNFKMDLTEASCEGVNGIHLDHNRYQWRRFHVNTVINLWVALID